jgi:hypothetical protein
MNVNQVLNYKWILCIASFICGVVLLSTGAVNDIYVWLGFVSVSLGPIFWNEWLYENLFPLALRRSV